MSAKLIQVIELQEHRGAGTQDDPCRTVTQHWSPEGEFLMERDPYLEVEPQRQLTDAEKDEAVEKFRASLEPKVYPHR